MSKTDKVICDKGRDYGSDFEKTVCKSERKYMGFHDKLCTWVQHTLLHCQAPANWLEGTLQLPKL